MYFWINFLLWNLGTLWVGLFFALSLEPRWERVPRWALALGFALVVLPAAYLKISHPLSDALYWAAFILLLLYVLAVFKDRFWKKALLFFLFIAVTEISEAPIAFLKNLMGVSFDATFGSLQMTLLVAADTTTVFSLSSILLFFWNRFITHRAIPRRAFIFLIFPVSQILMLFAFDGFLQMPTNDLLISVGALLGLIADFILLYILMEDGEKEALAKKLLELETLYRVENAHYQALEAKREETAKIRHDFNNQLSAAYNLIRTGEAEKAGELLDELKIGIAATSEYIYCANSIVNAVLTEKAAKCEKSGTVLKTEIELADEPSIQAMHLCSIFSNLCDNAINAADRCPQEQRFISIYAARKGDYFHVKVENSSPNPDSKKPSVRKAYGQEILKDIASRYNGQFSCGWDNGVYRAMLSLTI